MLASKYPLLFALLVATTASSSRAETGAATRAPATSPAASPAPTEGEVTPPAAAPSPTGWRTAIDLLTIGPGEHLWTSFGHTAVIVMRFNPSTGEHESKVYNWGDADFGGFGFMWSFFRGLARFRLTDMGSIDAVVNTYATRGRTMVQQRFAFTPEQVERVATYLRERAASSEREYVYHHMHATCATKLRDFLDDEIVGGAVRAQLEGQPDAHTPRAYGRKYFAGFFFAEIFNDLFLGREHDKPWTKYAAVTMPETFALYLQEVKVPDPKGTGALVPLLSAPTPIVRDVAPPPPRGQGRSLIHMAYLLFGLTAALGAYALRRRPVTPQDAGFWLLVWAVPAALASALMVFGAIVSQVAEGRINELLLVFPPTDAVLVVVGVRWWRGNAAMPRWLKGYAWMRLGLVGLSLLGHATGLLFQEPRVLLVFAALCATLLVAVVQRMSQRAAAPAAVNPANPSQADAA